MGSTGRFFPVIGGPAGGQGGESLDRFFSAPRLHLAASEIMMSSAAPFSGTRGISPYMSSRNMLANSRPLLDQNGNRLPSVLKKALPMPPEDIRSVPHVRTPSPMDQAPPVVSIGMSDGEGVPIPWKQTPEMTAWIAASTKDLSKKPGYLAEQIREAMRSDFENLEKFIEEAFGTSSDRPVMSS